MGFYSVGGLVDPALGVGVGQHGIELGLPLGDLADRIHLSLHGAPQPLVAELFANLKG